MVDIMRAVAWKSKSFVRFASVAVVVIFICQLLYFDTGRSRSTVLNYFQQHKTGREKVAFCVAARNQSLDLPEFLVHHYYHHHVRRFYIEDDGSIPSLEEFEYPGIPREALSFRYYTAEDRAAVNAGGHFSSNMQFYIYEQCATSYGDRHDWMAYFDVDEFLEIRTKETLEGILGKLERNSSIGALGVNWRLHTSGGQLERAESVRHTYGTCIEDSARSDNVHIKSIVRMSHYDRIINPHVFATKDPVTNATSYTVGEDEQTYGPSYDSEHGEPQAQRSPVSRNRLALHHYAIKSKAEYQEKIDRWSAAETPKNWGWWDWIEKTLTHVPCPEMTKYLP